MLYCEPWKLAPNRSFADKPLMIPCTHCMMALIKRSVRVIGISCIMISFGSSTTSMHPKFDPTEIRIHNL